MLSRARVSTLKQLLLQQHTKPHFSHQINRKCLYIIAASHYSTAQLDSAEQPIPLSADAYLSCVGSTVSQCPFIPESPPLSMCPREVARCEIFNLLAAHQYETLVDFLLRLALQAQNEAYLNRQQEKSADSRIPPSKQRTFRDILTEEETSYVIRRIIDFQTSEIRKSASQVADEKVSARLARADGIEDSMKQRLVSRAYAITPLVRKLYSAILFTEPGSFIYDENAGRDVYASPYWSGYVLTNHDYENLIAMEAAGLKLGLASTWFEAFERQFAGRPHCMTPRLWRLKFEVFCGGNPALWIIPNTDLANTYYVNGRRLPFVSNRLFAQIFAEFQAAFPSMEMGSVMGLMTPTIIYSLGYCNHVDALVQFIESSWGIDSTGKLVRDRIDTTDPNSPSIEHLRLILAAFAINNRYFDGMRYVYAFQKHYSYCISLSSAAARRLWPQMFRWALHATAYSPDRALQFFRARLARNKKKHGGQRDSPVALVSLEEAQQDANFDYEGYLSFIDGIKQTRWQTFDELWTEYIASGQPFHHGVCFYYLEYLSEELDTQTVESKYYALLRSLRTMYAENYVDPTSYNTRTDTRKFSSNYPASRRVRRYYVNALESLVIYKWRNVFAGQCIPLIKEWSLDKAMAEEMEKWFVQSQLPLYEEHVAKRRAAKEAELEREDMEEDEGKDENLLLRLM